MANETFTRELDLHSVLNFTTRNIPVSFELEFFSNETLSDLLYLGAKTKISSAANNAKKEVAAWNDDPKNFANRKSEEEFAAILMDKMKEVLTKGEWSYSKESEKDELDDWRIKAVRIFMKGNETVKAQFKLIPSDLQKERREFLLEIATKSPANTAYFDKKASELYMAHQETLRLQKESIAEAEEMDGLDLDI